MSGNGLSSDGVNDKVVLHTGLLGSSFSYGAWFTVRSLSTNQNVLDKATPAGFTYESFRAEVVTNGSISVAVSDSTTTRAFPSVGIGAGVITTNTRYHLMFTYSAGILSTYLS